MANKKIVFIHGVDDKQASTPWMFYHLHPSNYSKPVKTEGKTFDLVYFDFEKGIRKEWAGWSATRSTDPPAGGVESPLLPKATLRDASGTPYSPPIRAGTVEAFYRWVKMQPAGSIASIQIFSHATIQQPVLFADSFEWGDDIIKKSDLEEPRDPNDSEFRMRDFEGQNPLGSRGPDPWNGSSGSEMARFKAALASDVFIKVWGCGEQNFSHNDGDYIRRYLADYLKVKNGKNAELLRAQSLLSYLYIVEDFFPYRLAQRLDLPVWAGPVGWGSDPYDVDGVFNKATYKRDKYSYVGNFPPKLDKKELWWRVSVHFTRNTRLVKEVFQQALGAKLDPLGYIEYRKSWVEAALARTRALMIQPGPITSPFQAPARLMEELTEKMRQMGVGQSPSP